MEDAGLELLLAAAVRARAAADAPAAAHEAEASGGEMGQDEEREAAVTEPAPKKPRVSHL